MEMIIGSAACCYSSAKPTTTGGLGFRLIVLGALLISFCLFLFLSAPVAAAEPNDPGGSINNPAFTKDSAGRELYFLITIGQSGEPVGIDFRGNVEKGSLHAILVDDADNVRWQSDAPGGPFAANITLDTLPPGQYRLGIEWGGPTKGDYSLVWRPRSIEPATLSAIALLGGVGMTLVALGFVLFTALRRLGWRYLLLGALAWIVTVTLKFAWAIPVNPPVYQAITSVLPESLAIPLVSLYVGALTGVFEVGVTYLALRYTRLGRAPWRSALAFGIGFGAVEALLLGLLSLGQVSAVLADPGILSPSQLESLSALNNPLQSLAPIWERFFTIWIHVLSNVLIFYAIAVRKPRWFWLAFAFKTAIDSFAGYGQIVGVTATVGGAYPPLFWALEVAIGIFGVAGWILTDRIGKQYPDTDETQIRMTSAESGC